MSKLRSPVVLETAFGSYTVDEILGVGGAGRVYGGKNADGSPVAVKVLSKENASKDKRARFRKEIAFLSRNTHRNIVTVSDHGLAQDKSISGPFYVMPKFESNLRKMMVAGIAPNTVLAVFEKILNGVEAAHLQGVVHRDLKPENVLADSKGEIAIADFGIASFTEKLLITSAQTGPTQRLANFQYAAPEQRLIGRTITRTADIYALGLMLNEIFTTEIPHGTQFRTIAQSQPAFGYLDDIVAQMLRQNPDERPASIDAVKDLLQKMQAAEISRQRLSAAKNEVVKVGEIDDDLALTPPKVVGASWDGGSLTLTLDRPVHQGWVNALQNMGGHTSVMGRGPERFTFTGKTARIQSREDEAQRIIDYFKEWLPRATQKLKYDLETAASQAAAKRRHELELERIREESLLRVNSSLKI